MKIILCILILCLFVACVSNDTELTSMKKYKIDMSSAKELNYDLLLDSVYYIELETLEDNVIGEIGKVQIDSVIAIFDRMTQAIHLYSKQGKLLSIISSVGNGPGEYVRINDFSLNVGSGKITVLDGTQNKIITYSLDGNFIEEKKIKLSPGISRFNELSDGFVYDQQIRRNTSEDCFNLIVTHADGEVLHKWLPYNKFSDMILSPRNSFFYVNDTLAYLPTYSNVVFNIFEEKIIPRYFFDFGDKWIDEEYMYAISNNPISFIEKLKETSGIYFFNVTESGSHLFLDFMYKANQFVIIVSKSCLDVNLFKYPADSNCKIKNMPLTSSGDFFVTQLSREELPPNFSQRKDLELNPVLMFFKFK